MKPAKKIIAFTALLLLGLAPVLTAQILRLTLKQMVEQTDGAVHGTITASHVTHLAETKDGPDMFFTTLTIEGKDLIGGQACKVEVSFPGGFVDEHTGVWNSEAPNADDQRIGSQIVAFWKVCDDLGGGFSGNALYTSHGGLFRTFQDKRGRNVVLGRGKGYAVELNQQLPGLRKNIQALDKAKQERKARNKNRNF
ncbi:MAG: hypothetical protein OSB42_02665 [Planctomycetota bacterium]|nr:hypothetical protein [Planctomycetota bacterium]